MTLTRLGYVIVLAYAIAWLALAGWLLGLAVSDFADRVRHYFGVQED